MIDELSLCSNLEYIPEKCIDNYFIYIWRSLVGYLNELPAQSSIYKKSRLHGIQTMPEFRDQTN